MDGSTGLGAGNKDVVEIQNDDTSVFEGGSMLVT